MATSVCDERGLRVPDDVSIVGFDDVPEAAAATPPLTTVRQPLAAMGRSAVDLLVRMIDDDAEPTHIRMSADLVVRGSTLSRSGGSR